MNKNLKKTIDYYKRFESRIGYTFVTYNIKHFGYYQSKKADISEKEAQMRTVDLLANKLELKPNDLVLDAGCGRGTVSCYLAQKYGVRVIGIDIVPFELEMAKKRARDLNLGDKVKFYLQDYSRTKFKDNMFDKVFTLETLVHSPNIHKTLSEFYRILKKDGRLGLFEYTLAQSEAFNPWERKMMELIIKETSMSGLRKMFHNTFIKFLRKAKFEIILDLDISEYMEPSRYRFYKYAKIPYTLIKFLNLQKYFINTTAGVEWYKMGKRGLVKYRVFIGKK